MIQSCYIFLLLQKIQAFQHSLAFSSRNCASSHLFVHRHEDMDNKKEVEILQNELVWIEAIEERNKAQIGSFMNEQDQWDSMEEWEQDILKKKESHIKRIEELSKMEKL